MTTHLAPQKTWLKINITPGQSRDTSARNGAASNGRRFNARSRTSETELHVAKQPAPRIPGITKRMVRQHLPCLLREKVLNHRPATLSEWLLVEWHLARKRNLSPLRLAYFFSEPVGSHGATRHDSRLSPAH